ncbi:leishmanolysin peptidase-like protein [Plakobranchus ocellatus]|uniref:Leishmanolysin-like peptidase n=1 Tax=Plakobranchus ocellatus TaxID=259542 RepID=A0AAV4DW36_9GAST|nr:leishmanolysin peptidase-like protein [Plakobranchus ocellatus]
METQQITLKWVVLVIVIQPCFDVTWSNSSSKPLQGEKVEVSSSQIKLRRSNDSIAKSNQYQPLRIATYYSLGEQLTQEEKDSLRQVIERAVWKVQSILSVRRMTGPLLLLRKACHGIRHKGINKGKCGLILRGYSGEYCLDGFKIPDSHLEGFLTYSVNNTRPPTVHFEDGEGLNNTDFVLYITSYSSDLCNPHKTSALAYASFCQLGELNRPMAGQVNFCPRNVKMQRFDEELLFMTSVHEILHVLGFSSKLFDKFVKCDEGVCKPWQGNVLFPRDGGMRLITDAVVREMRNHFNCTDEPGFGGPLEVVNGKITSHWDPYLMHSSVMGSREQKPYATLIDRISLAVFEDSGWYKVNYSMADSFLWGKGQGCSFGLQDVCDHQAGFCSGNASGCHHLRLSKARCSVNPNSPKCGVFSAYQIPCFHKPINSTVHLDETFLPTSRCFMSNITVTDSIKKQVNIPVEASPRCYETNCKEETYFIKVSGGRWTLCPPGSLVKIPPYEGRIHCPSYMDICSNFTRKESQKSQQPFSSVKESLRINTKKNLVMTEPHRVFDSSIQVARNSASRPRNTLHIDLSFLLYSWHKFSAALKEAFDHTLTVA